MKVKGILFDKDGTLIKFKEIWVEMMHEIIEELLESIHEAGNSSLKQRLGEAIGLLGNEIDEFGFLASGTTHDLATVDLEIPFLTFHNTPNAR